ncbi:MAG: hypothetical protein ACOC7M_01320, partial [Chloroflexota bacterium]
AITGQVPAKKEKGRKKLRTRGCGQIRCIVRLMRTRGLGRGIARLLSRLVRQVRVRSVLADFRVGLDDPCDTALVVGTLSNAMMAVSGGQQIRLKPAFGSGLVFQGDAVVTVRLFPITLLMPLLMLLVSPSTWRVVVTLIRWKISNR